MTPQAFACRALCFLWIASCSNSTEETHTANAAPMVDASAIADASTIASNAELQAILDSDFEQRPERVELDAPCAADRYLGGFRVEMNSEEEYTFVEGIVSDAPNPALIRNQTVTDKHCRLLEKPRFICDPPCNSGTSCGPGETCQTDPVGQDLGTAIVRGMLKPLIIEPVNPGNVYFNTRLPHPGFAPNQVIHLATTDGFLGPLELYGVGVVPLERWRETIVLAEGDALVLSWDTTPNVAQVLMHVELDIDLHGVTPLRLVCDFPDSGSGTVSATLVDQLIASGVTGFPKGTAARQTIDALETEAGCADFRVRSVSTLPIEVTGHTPCQNNHDCTAPETCDKMIQQCG